MRSPVLTKSGTCTVAPVSSFAGFVTFETVSPLTPGSVSTTSSSTDAGSDTPDGLPSTVSTCTLDDGCMKSMTSETDSRDRLNCSYDSRVHEDHVVARVVEVLRLLHLGVDARELLAGAEGAFDDGARVEALHLRAHERAALARLHVLELDDAPDVPVELDVHAVAELVRVDGLGHGRQPSGARGRSRHTSDPLSARMRYAPRGTRV